MANPEITVCGRLTVAWDGEQLEGELPGRQGRLIFAYLVLNRSRPVRRDELVEALWADEGLPSGGEALLAPPLSRLRKALGKDRLQGRADLSLQLGEEARIDFEVAQQKLASAQNVAGNPDATADQLEAGWDDSREAAGILEGGLLPGLEARWIEEHRLYFEELRLKSLETVARIGARLGTAQQAQAERAARNAVEASPFRESARAALIELLEAQGNIAEALRAYEEMRVLLRDELGTFPAPELTAIHERLLNAHETPAAATGAPAPARPAPAPKPAVTPKVIGQEIDPRVEGGFLIGREHILDQLRAELDLAASGELRIALLAGEGGVGKTRLAAELASSRDDITVLYGRSEPDEVRPFRIWSGLLQSAVRQLGDIDPAEIVGGDGPTLSRLLPELTRRMGLPAPGPTSDLESERQALFGAVMRMIGRFSARRPMLIILDDLHWADRSTLRLLASMAGENPLRSILAVGIYRDTELPPESHLPETLSQLQRRLPTTRLQVQALDEAEVRDLISGRLDEKLAPLIRDQTGGNPFFIEQMIRNLEESGEQSPSLVPPEIREIISQRVSRLPEGGPELLGRAALIGRDFDLGILGRTTSDDDDRIIELLDTAVSAGLLDESSAVPGRYSFVHALVRSSLSDSFSLTRRAAIHRRIGEAIEQRNQNRFGGQRNDDLPVLAWHFSQSGPAEADRAINYANQAARQAEERLAYDEAVDFYDAAINACRADEPVDQGLLAELLLSRAEAEWRMALLPQSGRTFSEAAAAARESGIPELLARAAMGTTWGSWDTFESDREEQGRLLREALEAIGPGDSPYRAQLLSSLAQILYFSDGRSAEAREMALEGTGMADRLDDPYTFFVSNIAATFLRWEPDGTESRLPMADRLVKVAESSEDPEDLAEALSWRSVVQVCLGHRAEADADLARFDVLAKTLPQIRVNQAALHTARKVREGRWAEAEQLIAKTIAQEIPNTARIALTDPLLFMIRAEQNRLGEHFDQVKAMAAQSTSWEHWPTWRMGYYLAMTQCGRGDEVLERVDRFNQADVEAIETRNITFLSFCALGSMVACEIEFRRGAETLVNLMEPYVGEWVITGPAGSALGPVEMHLGEICLLLGRDREAATWLERSVDNCEGMGARPYLAHSKMHLALALRRLGNPEPERAEELMSSGQQIAEELDMQMLLNR
ncbi:MAG TPA: AAA family ATPase, partial [Solirubrobacterales bacterium]|nr:AAA family ATPase [Solirubrobacterales bacterium]